MTPDPLETIRLRLARLRQLVERYSQREVTGKVADLLPLVTELEAIVIWAEASSAMMEQTIGVVRKGTCPRCRKSLVFDNTGVHCGTCDYVAYRR